MTRRTTLSLCLALLALCAAPLNTAIAQSTAAAHKLVMQVSDNDPAKWDLALNNARNVQTELGKDSVDIEIVAYGPGINMLKLDSVVGGRVSEAVKAGVKVVACEITMRNQNVKRDDMLTDIGYVDSGVVELMRRQRQGYAYVRP